VYSQIVVPIDGGPFSMRAIGPAARVAEASDADLLLVSYAHTEVHSADLRATLNEVAASVRSDVKVRTKVEQVEDVAAAIVAEVDADPTSLVCMASVGRSRTAPILGSVAEAVLREVSTPVLLIGPEVDVDNFDLDGNIEVTVDGSATSEGILPIAASWSIVYHLGLRVVTVLETADHGDSWMESGYVRNIAEKLERDVTRHVDHDVLHGDVVHRVLEDAAQHASVLAMATHGRTGLPRLASGSVTMAAVHGSTRPVLVYRPLDLRR
jgi:nucleotide-binding universal stress UspA family protein